MIRTSRLIALSVAFAVCLAVSTAPPARSGCVVICDGGVCPNHYPSGIDSCTGQRVCAFCAE